MSDIAETDLVFDGVNGLMGDIFVRNIRRRVVLERIHDDDRLIAEMAASYLQGLALDWYEDHSEEIQESWKLLRRAILTRWPSSAASPAPAPTSSTNTFGSNIPTPAAAPPNVAAVAPAASSQTPLGRSVLHDVFKNGRIRVEYADGPHVGYVSTVLNHRGNCQVTSEPENIAIVSFTPKGPLHDISFTDQEGDIVKLGIILRNLKELIGEKPTWGSLMKITSNGHKSSTSESGPWRSDVWSISTDGQILANWEVKPRVHRDLTFKYWTVIGVTNDFKQFQDLFRNKSDPDDREVAQYTRIVKLFFEPL